MLSKDEIKDRIDLSEIVEGDIRSREVGIGNSTSVPSMPILVHLP